MQLGQVPGPVHCGAGTPAAVHALAASGASHPQLSDVPVAAPLLSTLNELAASVAM